MLFEYYVSVSPKQFLKINIVDIYTLFEGNKDAGKQNYQFLVFEVVGSQQWRISFDKV